MWLMAAILVLGSFTLAQSTIARRPPDRSNKERPELVVQLGHAGKVMDVAVSRDGRFVLTGGDRTALLWDIHTGQLVRKIGDGSAPISVAFSGDGRYVLTAGFDKTAYLWLTATGKEVMKFKGHEGWIMSATFSPDERSVLTRSMDGTARIWDRATGKEVRKFEGLGEEAVSALYTPDGRSVLTSVHKNDNYEARLWNLSTNKLERSFPSGAFADFSPDGRLVLAAGNSTTIMYRTANGEKVLEFDGTGPVLFSPDGRYVLTPIQGTGEMINPETGDLVQDDTAQLWDATSGKLVRKFVAKEGVRSAAFTPDGSAILLGTERRVTHMFDVASGRELRRFDGYADFVRAARFSPDGRYMTTESGDSFFFLNAEQFTSAVYSIWNFATGQQFRRFVNYTEDDIAARTDFFQTCGSDNDDIESPGFAFSPDGNYIAIGHCKYAVLLDVATRREVRRFEGFSGRVKDISFSPEGRLIALAGLNDRAARLFNVETSVQVKQLLLPEETAAKVKQSEGGQIVHFLPDGRFALATGQDPEAGYAFIWDTKTWKQGWIRLSSADITFSSDYRLVLIEQPQKGTATLRETVHLSTVLKSFTRKLEEEEKKKSESEDEDEEGMDVMDKKLSPDGLLLAKGSIHYTTLVTNREQQQQFRACLFDVETGKRLGCLKEQVTSFSFTPDSRFLITSGYDRTTRVWDVGKLQEVCRLLSFRDGTWVVVAPDGRFDTNNLEEIQGIHWVFPDEPMNPLPLEIFLRDYFEPRLLPRLLRGSMFKAIRPLGNLNRAQPKVKIVEVRPEPGSADRVAVTVAVTQGSKVSTVRGQAVTLRSGAYDLHLFRDGQLVARWPDPKAEPQTSAAQTGPNLELSVWRRTHEIRLGPDGTRRYTFHNIRLPQEAGITQAEFTAYAFNSDRVKSATSAPQRFSVPAASLRPRPRAYVITVGINANESNWNLDFAVQSARDIRQLLREKLADRYDIVDVQLLSMLEPDSPRIAEERATKANIKAVLDLLAGRSVAQVRRREIDPTQQMRRVTPNDLVFLFISSHGYADPQGNFYIIPADTGEPAGLTEERLNDCFSHRQAVGCTTARAFLAHSISTDDWTQWWKDIDAGEMLMVLDSCHSAAVPGREFKPGPLGDRGFGQLSYDKGMRILTATQPDKTARATLLQGLGHSLLTEALIKASKSNQQLTLSAWLQDAERRVPLLYKSMYPTMKEDDIQYPVLLDFTRNRQGIARPEARQSK